jgi:hypothetical protein
MDDRKAIKVEVTEEMRDAIEVTPEMIQVATEILWESGRIEYEAEGVDQLVVEQMLRSALALKSARTRQSASAAVENPDGFLQA